jgi:integrase
VASIERRVSKRGVVSWRVAWREGGKRNGRRDSETCDYEKVARRFAGLVEAAGEHRPEDYPKGCRGRVLAPAEPSLETAAPTFAQVVAEYLATLVDTELRTIPEYWRDLRSHVLPAVVTLPDGREVGPLGRLPVDGFTVDVIQAWINQMRTKTYGRGEKRHHYSAKTILNIHGTVVSPVFEYASFRGYCGANPCRWAKLPERRGRPIKAHQVLDIEELPDWIDCAYAVDDDTGDITALILGTGIRWGELAALRTRDVRIRRELEDRGDHRRSVDDRAGGEGGREPAPLHRYGPGQVGERVPNYRHRGGRRRDPGCPHARSSQRGDSLSSSRNPQWLAVAQCELSHQPVEEGESYRGQAGLG